ncbi:MAG: SDR family NAD(P)-dependent oxidoreductase [Thermoleophilia bacterium]
MAGNESTTDLMRLDGRVALVTGAGRGIGRAIAMRLAEAGAAVAVADLDADAALQVTEAVRAAGGTAEAAPADVSDEADVKTLVRACGEQMGGLDVLVNNAGIFPMRPVLEMATADFDRVLSVNLRGAFLCTREAALAMVEQGRGGSIVNVTSVDALHPSMVGLAHYDASKHGMWGFTKNVALELAPHGIRVNAVAPGGVLTEGVREMGAGTDEVVAAFAERVPLQRMGDPDDIARAVLFLAVPMSAYMTGSQVVVDGGLLLR